MPKIGLMISATDANDVWHDYIDAFENAIQTPGVNCDPKPLHGAEGSITTPTKLQPNNLYTTEQT
jgi:hypothetical protein